MTSEKQLQANRRNAQKSTGPNTSEGKAAVRHNALKHGLLAEDVLLPREDRDELRELGERLVAELQPEGELEELLVEQIVAARWRLRRIRRVEAGVFDYELTSYESDSAASSPYAPQQHYSETTKLGLSFIRDANGANALSKLSRYEIPLERSLYRALHELQRLQAARHAEGNVSPPVAVDVDVSGVSSEDL
jgi:hypothetical protein